MKTMKMKSPLVLGLILGLLSYNQLFGDDIHLFGTVENKNNSPISGVKVSLKYVNQYVYTDDNGYFEIYNTTTALDQNTSETMPPSSFNGSKLTIYSMHQQVMVEVFDLSGRFVKRIVDNKLLSGSYTLYPQAYLSDQNESVYIVRVMIGNSATAYKMIKNDKNIYTEGLSQTSEENTTINDLSLKSQSTVDTIIFTHAIYKTKKVPLSSYIDDLEAIHLEEKEEDTYAPILTGPSVATATFELNWTFSWPYLMGSNDHYELEYSYEPNSGFQVLIVCPDGDRTSPYSQWITPEAVDIGKTTYFRVRAHVSGTYRDYSNIISVNVPYVELGFNPIYDNLLMYCSNNSATGNTVYQNSGLGVGANYIDGWFIDDWLIAASTLYFNISNYISGRTITKATLVLYVSLMPGDWNTNYKINPIAGNWNAATLTYNNQPNYYTNWSSVKSPPVSSSLPWEVDVTSIVQAWASGSIPNYGMLIRDNYLTFPGYTAYRITEFYSNQTAPETYMKPQLYLEIH